MPQSPGLVSSEIGTLWMTYQQKTMSLRMLEYFIKKADDEEARKIMVNIYEQIEPYVEQIVTIFQEENLPIPTGFTSVDVNEDVPKLYDNGFDIMLLRLIKEISTGMHTLNLAMSYREDITKFYRELSIITQKCYEDCTQYLLDKGLIAKAPYVAIEQTVEYVSDTNYLGGLNPFSEKRPLSTVEIAHLYHGIDSNKIGLQMIKGFAQCAEEEDVKKYFDKGIKLAKKIVDDLSKFLEDGYIQVPGTDGGNVTTSSVAPFSDKLMLYCVNLFCGFSIGGSSLGTSFSLRNDIPARMSYLMKDIFSYAHEGAKIMIKYGWMEESPQTFKKNQ
ncbi:hypothetical protein J2R98_001290 [Alkalibacillus filiformis]|uniref:DUF3231 family protein n=1 Tax=Alkalibacillus filiformis TaxID=200990 RepID=A0ABU0DT67_9BACI|nr:DUF3231 family protein [Alkalibacillus filiformis]MDQ0351476.1 hypothetical protein [Alkalibacillus filiformis]